jgi:hypothetical protein
VLWPGAKAGETSLKRVSPWFDVVADRFYLIDRSSGLREVRP